MQTSVLNAKYLLLSFFQPLREPHPPSDVSLSDEADNAKYTFDDSW